MSIAIEKNEKAVLPIKTLDLLAKGYGWKKPGVKTYSPVENIPNYYKQVGVKVRLFIAIDQEQQKITLIPLWKWGGSYLEPMARLIMPTYDVERWLDKGEKVFNYYLNQNK